MPLRFVSGLFSAFLIILLAKQRLAQPCFAYAYPRPGVAFPVPFDAMHLPAAAPPYSALPVLCTALLLQGFARLRLCYATPCHCFSMQIRRVADTSIAAAMRGQALPQPCGDKRCHFGAKRHEVIPGLFIALHCPALPSLSELCQCLVLLCYSVALQVGARLFPRATGPVKSLLFRRLSARTIVCAVQSLVKNCPTQPSALRGRPFAQGVGWLIIVRMRWRSASGFSVPCSTTTSSWI